MLLVVFAGLMTSSCSKITYADAQATVTCPPHTETRFVEVLRAFTASHNQTIKGQVAGQTYPYMPLNFEIGGRRTSIISAIGSDAKGSSYDMVIYSERDPDWASRWRELILKVATDCKLVDQSKALLPAPPLSREP